MAGRLDLWHHKNVSIGGVLDDSFHIILRVETALLHLDFVAKILSKGAVFGEFWVRGNLEATRAPAFFVVPELDGVPGQFEDSGFYLPQGEKRTLQFKHGSQNAWNSYTNFTQAMQNLNAYTILERFNGDTQHANLRIHHLQNSFDS